MKSSNQNRGARCVVAALIESTLSEDELSEIANEFIHGGDLPQQIGKTIKAYLEFARNPSKTFRTSEHEGRKTGNPLLDEALAIIKKRRLSKVGIVKKMGVIMPEALDVFSSSLDRSVESLLSDFFGMLTASKGFAFLELLDGPPSKDDEYLKGIMREKR